MRRKTKAKLVGKIRPDRGVAQTRFEFLSFVKGQFDILSKKNLKMPVSIFHL